MKKYNLKRRLVCLYIGSFLACVMPLASFILANWNKYTQTPNETIKICAGGIIGLTFLALSVLGKLKVPSRMITYAILLVMSYLLQAILEDLVLILFMAFLGELIDEIFFKHAIRSTKEHILVEHTSNATTEKMEEIIKKYAGRI